MRDVIVAFQAALLGTALEALGRFTWNGPYLPELMAQKFFALIPPWGFTPLFRTFGYNSKYYAFAAMVAAEVGGLTWAGTVMRGWLRRRMADRKAPWRVLVIAAPLTAAILVGLLPLLDAGVAGQALGGGIWATVPSVLVLGGGWATLLACGRGR